MVDNNPTSENWKKYTVSNPLAGTNYIISSSTYFQFFFVLVMVCLNKVYQIDINTLTRLTRNVVVTCEISTHTHIYIRIWDPGSNHAGKATWQVSHSLLIDWSSEHTRPKTRKPFHKVCVRHILDSWLFMDLSQTIYYMSPFDFMSLLSYHFPDVKRRYINHVEPTHDQLTTSFPQPPYKFSSFSPSHSK